MALGIRKIASTAFFLNIIFHSSAYALTDYIATGTFFGDSLEVIEYDDNTGDQIFIDAFLDSQPFGFPATFSLSFTLDESVDGRVPLFSQTAFFDGAISNLSLDINGINVFSSATEVATVGQFPGDFQGLFDSRWGWSFFPDMGSIALPDISVTDNVTFEPLGTGSAQGFSFNLFDSTDQIFSGNGSSILDLISPDINDFDGTSLQLFWFNDFDEEPEFGEEPPEINYTAFASIDTLTNLTAVPLPGGIWLLLSALSGFFVVARRNLDA